jgi:Domain of unknown function (DUF397)
MHCVSCYEMHLYGCKRSYSQGVLTQDHVITVRDSKNPDGPKLVFTPAEWEAFTAGLRDGEFDID